MCGIAGFLGREHAGFAATAERYLRHRGPDDRGHHADADAILVHRRLAIMDPSDAGHQPMVSACGRYVIVFNGEIYNYRDLRSELVAGGMRIRSGCDTEVALELFIREGPRCLARFRGMYALCIWDREEHTAFLARDPLGIKPLYCWRGPAGELAFASELRVLLATDLLRPTLDLAALTHYLAFGSLPTSRTLVTGITSLPPGHYGVWKNRKWVEQRFWHPDFQVGISDREAALNCARQALESSVQAHLTSDVPIGLFLSGGLDSGSILALAEGRLPTISVGFSQAVHDESGIAARVAAHFGAEHHVLDVSSDIARAWLPEFLTAMDQPSVDGFNTFCVARAAHEHGFKAMLSGLGGDELFGGYPTFTDVPSLLASRRRLQPAAGGFAAVLAARANAGSQRMAALLAGASTLDAIHCRYRSIFTPREIGALLRGWGMTTAEQDAGLREAADDWGIGFDAAAFPTDVDRIAWLETVNFLSNRLLRDSDTFGMAAGVEIRAPFADATLFDAVAPITSSIRLAPGKALLKHAVPELPEWLTALPKRGFTFPFEQWLDDGAGGGPGFLASWRLPSVPSGLDIRDWNRRWALLVLGEWLERHLGLTLSSKSSAA